MELVFFSQILLIKEKCADKYYLVQLDWSKKANGDKYENKTNKNTNT